MNPRVNENRKGVIVPNDGEDEVDAVLLRSKVGRDVGSAIRDTWHKFQENGKSSLVLSYLTIRVLFWDIGIALGDTITDFCQGIALLSTPGKEVYGIITIGINWLPGIPAAVHLLSMYRNKLDWKKSILYAILLIIFYPVVPILAYINILWKKPKSPASLSKEFRQAEFLATMAHAISGGIESPVQLIFQSWMIFNGIIQFKWIEIFTLNISDWQGNTIYLPMTASASVLFSIFSILKAAMELNIVRVHVEEISSWSKALKYLESFSDHFSFIAAETLFRISSILFCLTYLNSFGFIPIAAFWIITVILGQRIFSKSLDFIPLWIISFISIFMPICFSSRDIKLDAKRQYVIHLQYRTFKYLSLTAFLLYGVSLSAMVVIVYLPFEATNFHYNPNVIFDHVEFMVLTLTLLLMGLIAGLHSLRPSISSICHPELLKERDLKVKRESGILNNIDFVNKDSRSPNKDSKCRSFCFILSRMVCALFVFSPFILAITYLSLRDASSSYSYVSYNPTSNHTVIVKAIEVSPFEGSLQGVTRAFLSKLNTADPKTQQVEDIPRSKVAQYVPPGIGSPLPVGSGQKWIAIMDKNALEEVEEKADNALALVILDYEKYRPSSPKSNYQWSGEGLKEKAKFRIRMEDQHMLRNVSDGTLIWITKEPPKVDPVWKCSNSDCLEPNFTDDGFIIGDQYRTKSCFWAGGVCHGYTNEIQQCSFCNSSEVRLCPLNGQEFGVFSSVSFYGIKRSLRSSPASCVAYQDFLLSIEQCDSGNFGNGWSQWLEWQVHWQDGDTLFRGRRRYCYLSKKESPCIYEEQNSNRCCAQNTACNDATITTC